MPFHSFDVSFINNKFWPVINHYTSLCECLYSCAEDSSIHMMHFFPTAITVMFNQTVYSVTEGNGPAQPVLVLSNPSSTQFNVTVTSTDGSATGEYCS